MPYQWLKPKRSLGQNFLIDENIARKIIASLHLTDHDWVLEIGAGTGMLTKYLIERAGHVVAVEIDRSLIDQMHQNFGSAHNLRLLQTDVLKISWDQMLEGHIGWKVVANLPYHITSPVLIKLFDHHQQFDSAILMVQKEVAQRLSAGPNSKAYGILSVFAQFYSEVQVLFDVSRHVFFPKPKVTSAVVQLKFKHDPVFNKVQEQLFRRLVRGTFNHRRKILRNSLEAIQNLTIDISKLNFDLTRRPEQLTISDFIDLTRLIADRLSSTELVRKSDNGTE